MYFSNKSRKACFYIHTEYRLIDSGHSAVSNVAGSLRKYSLIRGLNMCMRTGDHADASVQIITHSLFLRGCFSMEIKKHGGTALLLKLINQFVRLEIRIVRGRRHIYLSQEIYHSQPFITLIENNNIPSRPWRRNVRRPDTVLDSFYLSLKFSVRESMIP